MIVARVNLAVLSHVQEDAAFPPLHADVGPLLLLGMNYGDSGDAPRSHGPAAQTCSFSRQIVEFCCLFVAESWCPATPDEKVGQGI